MQKRPERGVCICAATRKCRQKAGSITGGDSTAGKVSRYFRVVSASTKISVERRLASADLVALNEHRPGPSIPVTVSKCRPGFNAKVTDSAVLRWAAICSSTITPIAHLLPTAPMSRVTTTFPVEAPWSGSANTRSAGAGLTIAASGCLVGIKQPAASNGTAIIAARIVSFAAMECIFFPRENRH